MSVFNYNTERPFRGNPDLHLHYWGHEHCAPRHSVGPGIREIYKIHFIHDGTGSVSVGEDSHTLQAGQAFLTYPHIVTHYAADQQNPWTYSWIAFTGEQVEYLLSKTSLSPGNPVFPMDQEFMPELYERLRQASQITGSLDLPLKAILYQFFTLLLQTVPASPDILPLPKQKSIYVEQCLHFLHSHYCENVTVEMMSSTLKLDRKYLSSLFKKSIGLPPQQYLLNFRMAKASDLLAETQCTIGEIAHSVGYQDALLFSRMFKKVKGCSPKEYRFRHLNNDIVL